MTHSLLPILTRRCCYFSSVMTLCSPGTRVKVVTPEVLKPTQLNLKLPDGTILLKKGEYPKKLFPNWTLTQPGVLTVRYEYKVLFRPSFIDEEFKIIKISKL